MGLRKGMGVFANLRPVRVHPDLVSASPLKPERLAGVDLIVVRELTGGLYFGQPKGREVVDGIERAVDTLVYTDEEIRRVVRMAFELAGGRRKKVTSVDKANVLESSRLWRKVTAEVAAEFPDVELENMLVDTAAMRLVASPANLDVLVTENMFGDILTDEASVLTGSMGMLPSASLARMGGLVRTHRLRAGYRREGHRQPARHHFEHGPAAALFAQAAQCGGAHRAGSGPGHQRWAAHRRSGREAHQPTNDRRGHRAFGRLDCCTLRNH